MCKSTEKVVVAYRADCPVIIKHTSVINSQKIPFFKKFWTHLFLQSIVKKQERYCCLFICHLITLEVQIALEKVFSRKKVKSPKLSSKKHFQTCPVAGLDCLLEKWIYSNYFNFKKCSMSSIQHVLMWKVMLMKGYFLKIQFLVTLDSYCNKVERKTSKDL